VNLESLRAEMVADTGPLRQIRERAAARPRRLLFAESRDERILLAAALLSDTGLAEPLLLQKAPYAGAASQLACRLPAAAFWDPDSPQLRQEVAALLWRKRRHRGLTQGQAYVLAAQPLYQAAALVALGQVEGMVAGARAPTADVVRAALWAVGVAPGTGTVSGAFLMVPPANDTGPLLLADCAAVPVPQVGQLVDIGRATGQSFERLFGRPPAVAFLSFSTHGTAQHPEARKVAQAAQLLAAAHPQWCVVGEVQADAALVPEVAHAKGISWGAKRTADVLIFPDLSSGNIGSKLVERLGGWRAVGPFLQGLRRPVCDLSRGCTALDVLDAAVLISVLVSDGSG
jgi:phosphate acetyltransferase